MASHLSATPRVLKALITLGRLRRHRWRGPVRERSRHGSTIRTRRTRRRFLDGVGGASPPVQIGLAIMAPAGLLDPWGIGARQTSAGTDRFNSTNGLTLFTRGSRSRKRPLFTKTGSLRTRRAALS